MSRRKRAQPKSEERLQHVATRPAGSNAYFFPLLVIAVLLAYQPVWHGGVLWDDDGHLTSPELQSVDGLRRIWFELGATQQYYPVVHSAFWVFHRIWGDDTLGYHLVNILLHALSAGLVTVILWRLGIPGAAIAGMLFALHPVHVESVAWMTELKNMLSGVLCLAAGLTYLRFDDTRSRWPWWLAFGLFLLAVLAKSVTTTLPAVLLVVFWWRRGRLDWRRDFMPLQPFFVIGIMLGLLTAWVEHTYIGARGAEFQLTLVERALVAGRAFWFYLGKLLWPVNLIFVYPRWQISQGVWWQYLFPLAVIGALALAWRLRTSTRAPLAALLIFGGVLFPALGFFNVYPFRFSFVADHFQYLASIPILALIGAGLAIAGTRLFDSTKVPAAAALVLGGVLGTLTWLQSRHYVDGATLYRETIARNPGAWMAYNNLGALMLESGGDAKEAAALIEDSLRIYSDNAEAHNNLGVAFQRLGRLDDAEAQHREAMRLYPAYAEAYNNLGIVAEQKGRLEEAVKYYTTSLTLQRQERNRAESHHNLGSVLQKLGRNDEAIAQIREALRIRPGYADAHGNLGTALLQSGRPDEAIAEYREALRLKPGYAQARNNLGTVLAKTGRLDEAVAEFQETLRLKPDATLTYINLADALRRLKRRDEAVSALRMAIRLQPEMAIAHYSLGNVLQDMGQFDAAVRAYREALRYEPEARSYYIHNDLGVALAQLGRRQEALAEFERALQIKPDFADARANRARVLR